ncbi:hypothetical protein GH733_010558 [Mirounga leonina]|nr:hypothetical protein GH733_010558 [Mirounga leonina]
MEELLVALVSKTLKPGYGGLENCPAELREQSHKASAGVSPPNQHPSLSIGDVAKKRGQKWNNSAVDDKQLYEEKAGNKYKKETAAYGRQQLWESLLSHQAKNGVIKAEK